MLKGLDIVIGAFKLLPELELFICGNMEWDNKFIKAIEGTLANTPNINILGWVDTSSDDFDKMASECAWVLNTSFSEGGGGSTLNCMAKGLVPVISKSASINLPDETGFYMEDNNADSLIALLNKIIELEDTTIQKMSFRAHDFIRSNHTIDHFKMQYKAFLNNILISTHEQ